MQRLLCIFGIHKYKAIKVYNYIDISYGGESPSTVVTFCCRDCRKMKRQIAYASGYLSLKEIDN